MMITNKISWTGQAEYKHYYSEAKVNRWSFILTVNYLQIYYLDKMSWVQPLTVCLKHKSFITSFETGSPKIVYEDK
jgi:hypothetical protein